MRQVVILGGERLDPLLPPCWWRVATMQSPCRRCGLSDVVARLTAGD